MGEEILITLILGGLAALLVMPIVALVRTRRVGAIERRLEGVEAALMRTLRELAELRGSRGTTATPEPIAAEPAVDRESRARDQLSAQTPAVPATSGVEPGAHSHVPMPERQAAARPPRKLEEIIGERWLGWIAVGVILFAAAFFLKYAFDNRWIGELGRVMIGVVAGMGFVWAGWDRHRKGWGYFAQVLTGGGVTLVYLSAYASYGFYSLIDPATAFAFLVLVVIQAHLLAVAYNSRGIALMGQIGGFLTPLLLSTGRDQYGILFTYIALLNIGVVILSFARGWKWVGTFSFALTHGLFWAWHGDHYHAEKLGAAMAFQIVIFVLYCLADIGPQLRGRAATAEQWLRMLINPFVFFATSYTLLHRDSDNWMGVFALVMAALYAALARAGLGVRGLDRRAMMIAIGVALTFVTLAIPIQLDSNWITIGWAVLGASLAWLGLRMRERPLQTASAVVLGLAVFHHLAWDAPWSYRPLFTPVLNRYFLSGLAVTVCLLLTAHYWRQVRRGALLFVMVGLALFWLTTTVETYTYFDALIAAGSHEWFSAEAQQLRWTKQMGVSVLWSVYAAALVAAGFRMGQSAFRWAGLGLFGLTLGKVFFVDMAELEQLYRIVAFLALGIILLAVAWAYQRAMRRGRQQAPLGDGQ